MSVGRPRVNYLRREQRRCHIHGVCEWTRYESINAAGIIQYNWRCMRCANDASKAVYRFQQLHPETIVRRSQDKTVTILADICTECWTIKAKNGTCFCE